MKINIRTNISENYGEDVEIVINTSQYTKEVGKIVETLQQITNEVDVIIGRKGNEISVIDVNEIISFYSNEQNNYCRTQKGDFIIKQRLYELEEILPKNNFIRISNSTIINIQFVECFDVSTIGNIIVKLKNGETEHVSKRRVSRSHEIFKREREEIVLKKVLRNVFKSIAITSLIIQIVVTVYLGIYQEETNSAVGYLIFVLPMYIRFTTTAQILSFSILIGSVIGVAMSIDEKSKKKIIITYLVMYVVILLILVLYEILTYGSVNFNNLLGIALEVLVWYTVVYVGTFIQRKWSNHCKAIKMNKELKN